LVHARRWKEEKLIDHEEDAYLLAALLEGTDRVANTAGTYYAYLKTFYRKALKEFRLEVPNVFGNKRRNLANQIDALDLVKKTQADVLYLDPPYNDRDYGAYYHLTETLALGNKPRVKGISGIPASRSSRSDFCNRETAATALERIVSAARTRCLVFHYSPNGLLPHSAIMRLLRDRGPTTWSVIPVRRYSSHHEASSTETACTRLYICRVR
jgi:adenine-specific DNA-methyltransferase